MRRLLRPLRAFASIGFLICAQGALAADVLPLDGALAESFLDKPPPPSPNRGATVGAVIVGVRLDGPEAPFDPAALQVRLGAPGQSSARLCLKLISRDGRYFARGQYKAPTGSDPAPALEFRTSYKDLVTKFSNRDVAAAAYFATNCADASKSEYVASQFSPQAVSERLVVQLRAGEARVRAQLLQDKTPVGQPVLCDRYTDGSTSGFTSQCTVPLPKDIKSGAYQLALGETATTGEIKVNLYALRLWLAP